MAKAATTMIFVGADRVARLDLGDAPLRPALFAWQAARLPGESLEQSVAAALEVNGRCGRGVWVLCEDSSIWTQMLSLSAAAVRGLDGRQLERVLGFELESLSGLGASESHVAFVPCVSTEPRPGQQDYWVTQVAAADCRGVGQLIRQAGGTLRGLLHPGGLPLPWGSPGESRTAGGGCATWRRIEVWGDVTFCLAGDSEGGVSTRIVGGGPAQDSWRPAVSRWLAGVGGPPSEQVELLARGSGGPSAPEEAFDGLPGLVRLPEMDGEPLKRWLALWAKALGESASAVPVIRPAAPARSLWWPVGVSAGMAAVALAACLIHGSWMRGQSADAARRLREADLPRQQVAGLDKQLAQAGEDLRQLAARRASRASADPAAALAGQRRARRIAELLAALSALANDSRVVTGLKSDGQGGLVAVEGLCLAPESADELAEGLARRLARAGAGGWQVRGAQKTARLISPDGGPWEFRISLAPAGAFNPAPKSGGSNLNSKPLAAASAAGAVSADGSPMGGR